MRDVVLLITCSLDGFIAAEDGNVDWLIGEEEYDFDTFLEGVETLLMGHKTYQQVLGFGKWPYSGKETYVFTNEHMDQEDGKVTFSNDPVGTTEDLMLGTGGAIWVVGGASVISQLLNSGLINEFRITIQPVILGKGIPLFREIKKSIKLELKGTQEFGSGLVELVYASKK
ncbi:dihydrofolate reductase family protein [Methanolobus profundi]|uniref:Dihydrofolate reductase n=1 Tax=Methanolobus profundi TaxID=487685 RepID=A0A1I4PTM0_9EURY|nr:dihydrofolate reductase family protein [Methanolobus profundi]SFM30850.1 Dihydrofolate reductase [Methanolobus profundi]